ncbi:MAG: tRNA lysidine(34) synthetase TilS [Candidatus Eremiobacteraeota bacterium]|nr:tRNA lysidine(34) synthetase TilS [Candidatus Eremiobacteraeota bacterium]
MRGAKPGSALEQTIERDGIVRRGDCTVVACSGGADSVALAAALAAVRAPMMLDLTLAYVHHGTRDSAWQDECVVLRVGASLGLPVRIAQIDGTACSESRLRDARYACLAQIAQDRGAAAVATAHHSEDQSETVLLALLRGAGTGGIGGMRARRPLAAGIDLIRPLLRVAPEDLRDYCHGHALPYAVDPSNADIDIRRNAVRSALAALRTLFPGLDEAVARTAEIVTQERSQTGRAQLRRHVRETLKQTEGLQDLDFHHVEAAVRALENGTSGRFHMKPGVVLHIESGTIQSCTASQ